MTDKIQNLLKKIYRSEDSWKARYMAVWGYANHIEDNFIDGNNEEESSPQNQYPYTTTDTATIESVDNIDPDQIEVMGSGSTLEVNSSEEENEEVTVIKLGLPGSQDSYYSYEVQRLHSVLTSMDDEFTLNHLQKMFSLLEVLSDEVADFIDYNGGSMDSWSNLKSFLEDVEGIDSSDIKELKLAKETRNCFMHNNSKIDGRWTTAYENARTGTLNAQEGDHIKEGISQPFFHQIEDWHRLFVEIAQNIEDKVKENEN